MGKRHNKNKNKKLLKNLGSEKKPDTSLQQECTKERHIKQKNVSQNSSKALLPSSNIGSSHRKFENAISEIKESDEHTSRKSYVMKSEASNIIESKAMHDYKGINSKQDSAILRVSGIKPKQPKKVISHPSINDSEFHLCEDLFSKDIFSSSSDNDYKEVSNPYDYDFFNSKDILDFSDMKEKNRDQEDCRIKNNPKVVISEKNWSGAHQKSQNEKDKIKNKPNKQISRNLYVTNLTAKHSSNLKDPFGCEDINGNKDYVDSNVYGAKPKYNCNVISKPQIKEYENCLCGDYNYSYEKRGTSEQKLNLKQITAKEILVSSVNVYNHSKDTFSGIYHKWFPERKRTLEKLQSLLKEVQDGRVKYNEAQANFKEFSAKSRHAKILSENMLVGFFASAMTMAFDAASGLSSFAQAFNTDSFQSKFQEIMDHDADITKDLYESRSQCVAEYQGIEEVMKKFHCDTLSSTVSKISDTLEVGKYWEAMQKAYRNDDMTSLTDIVGNFFNNACESEVLGKVCDSFGTYVTDNPAALEGCKSTGKSLYEYVNILSPVYSRKSLRGRLDSAVSGYLMYEDIQEVDRLKSNYIKSKLESQIEDAIDLLESEMEEICDTYYNLFKNGIQSSCE